MDPVDVVSLARALVDIDSTTGRERQVAEWLEAHLIALGYAVVRHAVDDSRFNLFATKGGHEVVLSTHLDCVPPFFPSRLEDGVLYGRGACDAKGILAAQVAAAERLQAAGERRVALLFVVGEERGSDGARTANRRAQDARYLVNGEPTDNALATAHRGVLRVKLKATGRAAHSACPAQGESAIEKLVTALIALRAMELPQDAVLGPTSYTVGLIAGGVAPNVVPPAAEAEVLFRTIGDTARLKRDLAAALGSLVAVEEVLELPAVTLETAPGFETAAFPFATDIPLLSAWGRPLLLGPGSVHVAHTDGEHVTVAALTRAVMLYETLVRVLLER